MCIRILAILNSIGTWFLKAKDYGEFKCFICHQKGHKAFECDSMKKADRKCYNCGGLNHEAKDCPSPGQGRKKPPTKAAASLSIKQELVDKENTESEAAATQADIESCIVGDELTIGCGKRIPIIKSACIKPTEGSEDSMPVVTGRVGNKSVSVLRDTGCSGVVIKRDLVTEEELTGRFGYMLLIDRTIRKVPIARVFIDTPYFTGEAEAQCLPDAMYDVIIGNIPNARGPEDPDASWEIACAVTRAQAKKGQGIPPLKVPDATKCAMVTREQLIKYQHDDNSLEKLRKFTEPKIKGDQSVHFEEKGGILYRVFSHPRVNGGNEIRQVVVPENLRNQVIELAHSSLMGGHMGIRKTSDRILSNFYWPGLNDDVARFCRTCDICQKTESKGKTAKVPLQKMPLIETPFKRVAVDLIGPIYPSSEKGYRYILSMVDYATRYPDAVPLKNIDTETVAEALLDMYSRLGFPEEVLSDNGTQFISECMEEVSRLLSIRQLTSTPYHPMCNGLVEKFNGTLKAMLRRLCSEQPKQWPRYINAVLFAYREVPQESTGFSPFELLYGRTVRGPIQILKELWTKEVQEEEVKTSYRYVVELRERLDQTLKIAKESLENSQVRYKKYFDKKTKDRSFQPGDQVLVLLPTNNNKLLMQWKGPYNVEKVVNKNDYAIKIGAKSKVYHANLLRKYLKKEEKDDVKDAKSSELLKVAAGDVRKDSEEEMFNEENLLEIGSLSSKESYKDVKVSPKLETTQSDDLESLIQKFKPLFTDKPGSTSLIEHTINLTSDVPVRSKPYSVPYGVRESLRNDIQEMQDLGIIRVSNSPYASPVVIVKKKDGSDRVCVDYRKLNKLTVFDPEPMVTSEDLFKI